MRIAFSPPDISDAEIEAVAETLRSGWITTGLKTKEFEEKIAHFSGVKKAACFSSATAALECALRLLGVGPGDEVITSSYTYTASASVIYHVGATAVLVDTAEGSYEMDYELLGRSITPRTKVVIPVDLAGRMCDYDLLMRVLDEHKGLFSPRTGTLQTLFDRVVVLADAAHAFGASYNGKRAGAVADFTVFSFHAVKNLTTAEGGALLWSQREGLDDEKAYEQLMMMSLHGQSKDALSKLAPGAWEYDICDVAWKCNMNDVSAAIGLAQLKRYPALLARRQELVQRYLEELARVGMTDKSSSCKLELLDHFPVGATSSCHLLLTRLVGKDQNFRNAVINEMANRGIACNVHYKPLPLFTAYRDRGFDIRDFPHALAQFSNELTLPLHTLLSDDDVCFVAQNLSEAYDECERSLPDECPLPDECSLPDECPLPDEYSLPGECSPKHESSAQS